MPAFRAHSADEIAHARTLYEETDLSPHDIAKILGIGTNTFYRRVKRWGWRRRRLRVEEVEAAAMTVLQGEKAARTLRLLTQTLVEVGRYRNEAAALTVGKRRRAEQEEVDLEAAREALRGKIAALCARERGEG